MFRRFSFRYRACPAQVRLSVSKGKYCSIVRVFSTAIIAPRPFSGGGDVGAPWTTTSLSGVSMSSPWRLCFCGDVKVLGSNRPVAQMFLDEPSLNVMKDCCAYGTSGGRIIRIICTTILRRKRVRIDGVEEGGKVDQAAALVRDGRGTTGGAGAQ